MPTMLIRLILWLLAALTQSAAASGLPAPVEQALRHAGIPQSAVGIVAQAIDERNPTVTINPRQPMNPASTIKLLTTFAALDRLGPAYSWQTEVWTTGPQKNGVLEGDLYLKGGGDPKLTHEQLWRLLRQVQQRGIREIRGDLVLDRGLFELPKEDPARFDAQPMRPYNVTPDALLINFNAATLTLVPESDGVLLTIEPDVANLEIINRLRLVNSGTNCGDWREALRADPFTHGNNTRLVLSGNYPAACGEQRWNMALMPHGPFAYGVFRSVWESMDGVMSGNWREAAVPADARRIAVLPAPTLLEVVRDINKFSNNVMARQVFLTLGIANGKRPVKLADAQAALREWMQQRGLDMPELVVENGSGLSRQDRISAESMSRLLQAAWKSAVMPELISSLPVTAVDGTMRKRLKDNGVAGQAHIKTGSLEGVKTIAGYVLDKSGRRWIVVFLVNHPQAYAAGPAQDALIDWIYRH
jgi:D-alanyl-D-alanine carboxypeptidase/D-alanyl-D-alanine-endopeptidase (penicillin-binding protein 4)